MKEDERDVREAELVWDKMYLGPKFSGLPEWVRLKPTTGDRDVAM
jgi:hypothetical protein